jgi:hypothetical protein
VPANREGGGAGSRNREGDGGAESWNRGAAGRISWNREDQPIGVGDRPLRVGGIAGGQWVGERSTGQSWVGRDFARLV